jgi:tetratricopeptide (TPR) repeat protein
MARHRFALVFLVVLSLTTSTVTAAEPYVQFVEALRQRQYFDTALEYLEWAETRPSLPADVKAVIPFEKATTLIALARDQKNPEVALATLNKAQLFLEQFLKANPDHPNAAKANADIATVLQTRGNVALQQARSPSNVVKKAEYLKQAKEYLAQARTKFSAAAEKYSKEYLAFGPHIEKAKEPEKFAKWRSVEQLMLRAQLDGAIAEYEEGQTFEKEDPSYKETLKSAAAKFEEIHAKNRSLAAGVLARIYQGKCFEEQGDLQKALGIYNEVLSHKGDDAGMRNLQAQVMHFKLICLNSAAKADFILVDKLATEWVKENPGMSRTKFATGIRYEQARALEALAKDKTIALPDDKKKQVLNEALTIAKAINSRPGEYRDRSQAMVTRLMAALNRDGKEPKDFETAYGMARELVNKLKEMGDAVKAARETKDADPEDVKRIERGFELHKNDTARLLNLALSLKDSSSKIKDVNIARYSLCYVYLLQGRLYDSAVLGEWVANRYAGDEDNDTTASDAAYVAMAAYARASNLKGNTDKLADLQKMIGVCDLIVAKWPKTPKEIDAWDMLGKTYLQIKEYEKAANALDHIPAESGKYLDAQLLMGQSLWEAAIELMNKPEKERGAPEKLAALQKKAQDVLKNAIKVLEPKLPEEQQLPAGLVVAKLTLAQIANQTNQFADAINLLQKEKRSVLSGTVLDKGEMTRPATGPKSVRFLQEVYKQILRADIGLQDLDSARTAMSEMEQLASGQGKDILPIYINLGRQFKEELDRLAKSDPEQYKGTLKSFESFLSSMLARKEGQTYSSLAWMGAMYVSLGEGIADSAEAAKYFAGGSQAYSDLVKKSAEDPNFCTKDQLLSAKAQLVACKRKAGEFEAALEMMQELLKVRPNAIDTQTEAAMIYQNWGAAGQADSPKKWRVAMLGDEVTLKDHQKIGMWGWAGLFKKLSSSKDAEKFKEQILEARYNIAFCRYNAGLNETGAKRTKDLDAAHTDIARTNMQNVFSDADYDKFNGLYRKIAEDMGKPVQDLTKEKSELLASEEKSEEGKKESGKAVAATVKPGKSKVVKPNADPKKAENSAMMLMGGVIVLFLIGGGAWFFLKGSKGKQKSLVTNTAVQVTDFGFSPMGDAPAPAPAAKKKVAPPAGQPSATSTAPRSSSGGATPAARPKAPKPKSE